MSLKHISRAGANVNSRSTIESARSLESLLISTRHPPLPLRSPTLFAPRRPVVTVASRLDPAASKQQTDSPLRGKDQLRQSAVESSGHQRQCSAAVVVVAQRLQSCSSGAVSALHVSRQHPRSRLVRTQLGRRASTKRADKRVAFVASDRVARPGVAAVAARPTGLGGSTAADNDHRR